jgi:hypothetical protein
VNKFQQHCKKGAYYATLYGYRRRASRTQRFNFTDSGSDTVITTKIKTVLVSASLLLGVTHSQASMFDNLVEAANGALATYGRSDAPSRRTDLTAAEVTAALREVLTSGCDNVVLKLQAQGYRDSAVRIELPVKWNKARKIAARIGYSREFDELERKLAEAAVSVAPATRELLAELIAELHLDNPDAVLHGGEFAATLQLRSQVGDELAVRLQPLVSQSLESVGVLSASDEIARRVRHLPVRLLETDFADHVVDESIEGFFHYLAQEERAIRLHPEKRTTNLLRRVFG